MGGCLDRRPSALVKFNCSMPRIWPLATQIIPFHGEHKDSLKITEIHTRQWIWKYGWPLCCHLLKLLVSGLLSCIGGKRRRVQNFPVLVIQRDRVATRRFQVMHATAGAFIRGILFSFLPPINLRHERTEKDFSQLRVPDFVICGVPCGIYNILWNSMWEDVERGGRETPMWSRS
jgi:hypothetical protein